MKKVKVSMHRNKKVVKIARAEIQAGHIFNISSKCAIILTSITSRNLRQAVTVSRSRFVSFKTEPSSGHPKIEICSTCDDIILSQGTSVKYVVTKYSAIHACHACHAKQAPRCLRGQDLSFENSSNGLVVVNACWKIREAVKARQPLTKNAFDCTRVFEAPNWLACTFRVFQWFMFSPGSFQLKVHKLKICFPIDCLHLYFLIVMASKPSFTSHSISLNVMIFCGKALQPGFSRLLSFVQPLVPGTRAGDCACSSGSTLFVTMFLASSYC